MADKGGLQLLPETRKRIDIKVPGENRFITIGAILIALVLFVYGGLWAYANKVANQISDADLQIITLEANRNHATENNLLTLSKQIGVTNQVLAKHLYWSIGL